MNNKLTNSERKLLYTYIDNLRKSLSELWRDIALDETLNREKVVLILQAHSDTSQLIKDTIQNEE